MCEIEESVEIVADDEVMSVVVDGKSNPIAIVENGSDESSNRSEDASMPTIYEIAGVDSSDDSLPDSMQQQFDEQSSSDATVGIHMEFLHSERRAKLRKVNANSDFEIQQLNQQIALTNQYTDEIIEMRREQTRLINQLRKEKADIASRNEKLTMELREVEATAKQITKSEAEVAVLSMQHAVHLQRLAMEKGQLRSDMEYADQSGAIGVQ